MKKKRLNARRNGRTGSTDCQQPDPDRQAGDERQSAVAGETRSGPVSGLGIGATVDPGIVADSTPPNEPPLDEPLEKAELRFGEVLVDESDLTSSPMLAHVQMVVGLIEGVQFSLAEMVHLLRRAMRQHSIVNRRRIEYILHFLHQHPP